MSECPLPLITMPPTPGATNPVVLATSLLPHCQPVCQPPNFLHLPLLTYLYVAISSTTFTRRRQATAEHHHFPSPQASPTLQFPHTHSTSSSDPGLPAAGGVRQDEDAGTPPPGLVPAVVVKGKRSKRQRVHAPPVVLTSPAEWSSSAASATAAPGQEDSGTSPSDEAASTGGCVTEEEEDMALCLMLLSRGEPAAAKEVTHKDGEVAVVKEARFRSRRPADGTAAGEFVYECKTCNKCFPSFQALGGHRTSHKKPRLLPPPPSEDKNNPANSETTTTAPSAPPPAEETGDATVHAIAVPVAPKQEPGTAVPTAASSSRHPRVHECSICGAEFASGQALGGHMRRHRPLVPAAAREDAPRKEKSLLELDLNMPAPCDEAETSPRFAFAVAERQPAPLLFPAAAASALVDCHY